jgi:hypothetical protein
VGVAALAQAVIPQIGWAEGLVLGAIVAPTDPVAAIATFDRIGVAARVRLLVEGESMLNDATALVAYRVALIAVVTGAFSAGDAALDLVLAVAGGIVVAVLVVTLLSTIGYVLAYWGYRLTRHAGGTLHVARGLLTTRATSIEERRLRGAEIVDRIAAYAEEIGLIDEVVEDLDAEREHAQVDHVARSAHRAELDQLQPVVRLAQTRAHAQMHGVRRLGDHGTRLLSHPAEGTPKCRSTSGVTSVSDHCSRSGTSSPHMRRTPSESSR